MKLSTENTGLDIPLLPTGLNQAVLTDIIDLGTQRKEFNGEVSHKREVRLGFTFPHLKFIFDEAKGPEMRRKSVWATLSAHPKSKIYNILTSISGKGLPEEIELTDYIGMNCLLNIKHEPNGNGIMQDKIVGYNPLMPGNEPVDIIGRVLDLENMNKEVFETLGEKEQEQIKQSPEYNKLPF